MTFQVIALIMTCAGCLLGLRFIFAGASVLKEWGIQETAGSLVVSRRIGAIYLGLALMFFLGRAAAPSDLRSAVCLVAGGAIALLACLGLFEIRVVRNERWRLPLGRRGGGARGRLRLGVVGRSMMAPSITLGETNCHARFRN